MKNQPILKELLNRKLDKLDEWRTSIKCVVLPQVWREFVQKLCGRDSNRFFNNIVRPNKRFSDSFSKEALEYLAKLHADDQAAIARQTRPHIDWLIDRIESVCNDAPVVLREDIEEARKKFDVGPVKKLLNDAVEKWSVREVSDPMSESVEQAHCSLVATVMSVIDVIEVGLTESYLLDREAVLVLYIVSQSVLVKPSANIAAPVFEASTLEFWCVADGTTV